MANKNLQFTFTKYKVYYQKSGLIVFVKLVKLCNFCKFKLNKATSPNKKRPVFFQIFFINMAVSIVAISIVSIIILSSNLYRTKQILISNCENMATSLAENYIIYDSLVSKRATTRLITYLDSIVDNSSTIDSITIIDKNRICLYHYDRVITGTEIPILPLNDKNIQTATIELGMDKWGKPLKQLCAFVSIKNGSGIIYGYAIVGIFLNTLRKLNASYILRYFFIIVATIFTAIITSYYIVSRIRKSLMGYEPESFADLLIRRNEVLENLEEGLLAIDLNGRISVCTPIACKLFNLPPKNYEGNSLQDLNICGKLFSVMKTGKPEYNVQQAVDTNNLLTNFIPMKEGEKIIGAVAIIHDHTTFTNMAEELTGFHFVVEALRSNMHNFKNELHIILGMLQLGESELAMEYITHFNSLQTSQNSVIKNIQNKTIAALILGKTNEAKEQGVDLLLETTSMLPRHNPFLSTSQLTVILGNLLENSIEATKSKEKGGEIKLFIKVDDSCIKINVDDNGVGIPLEIQNKILLRGFTTKSDKNENHGIGLYTVNEIIKDCNGMLQIDSSPMEGTSISIQINKKRSFYKPFENKIMDEEK